MKKDDTDKTELEKKLEEIQKEKAEKDPAGLVDEDGAQGQWDDKNQKIEQLEKSLKEQMEISKRAQHDYINLKWDFDRYQQNMKDKSASLEVDTLISVVKKFLPFVENLRKSLATIADDQKDSPLVKWLQMMYDNFLKTLESFNIKAIESVWLVPDTLFHEPVSAQPVEDENLKGKIVQEFERWFYYEKDPAEDGAGWDKRVVVPSKVVVGQ